MLRLAPAIAIAVLAVPVFGGLAGTVLPAFGYLPALGGDAFSLEPFRVVLGQPGLLRSCLIALVAGVVTAAISVLIVALFVGGWSGTRTFRRMQSLVSPLLAVPHAAAAFGLAFMIAPSGFVARLFSPWATGWARPPDWLIVNDPLGLTFMAGLVVKEVPFLLLMALAAAPQVPMAASARLTSSLGYGRTAGFLFTSWPAIYRQIRLAVFAVIAFASSAVDVAVILGPTTPAALPVRLVEWMNDPDLSSRFMASAGAVLQLGVTLAALVIWLLVEKLAAAVTMHLCGQGRRFRADRIVRQVALVLTALTALMVFGGMFVLALWSVSGLWQFPHVLPDSLSLSGWMKVMPRIAGPLATTVTVGLAATVLSALIVIASLARERQTGRTGANWTLFFLYLPLLVPQAGFVFGLKLFLTHGGVGATWAALVLVHMVFVLPYVFLSLSAPWRAFDTRYEAIAAGLGKSAWQTLFAIRLPMLSRAILVAMAVGFAVSVGQYLPTLLIGAGRLVTVTTEAVALGAGGNRRVIGIYAFVQMLLPFLGFAVAALVPALLFRDRRAMKVA
ncbi:ABC transporter permease [Oricola thermophila]|uniref:ABC transporter permease subunit n=1 Tax=Oricola thermophila TaxID=2742145 RepID=A0A6N1VIM6_9HYPH|nr:ABC transporter permease subunit [Oricola thermophila]QKV19575.1 ABC transporter permease subunit [Oricola thermophila]